MPAIEADKTEGAAGATVGEVRTVTLPVTGMTCAACQSHVERALRETAGVRAAQVNLLTNSARVTFDSALSKPEELIAAVREAGYDAVLPVEAGAAAEGPDAEDRASDEGPLRARAFYTLSAGALVLLLMNAHQWLALAMPVLWSVSPLELDYAALAVTLAGMIWGGGIIYRQAWTATVHGSTNMNTLVALGTGAAFAYSVTATVAPDLFVRYGLQPDVYYDAVLLILGFLLLGRWLDARAKRRTLDALREFANLQPRSA